MLSVYQIAQHHDQLTFSAAVLADVTLVLADVALVLADIALAATAFVDAYDDVPAEFEPNSVSVAFACSYCCGCHCSSLACRSRGGGSGDGGGEEEGVQVPRVWATEEGTQVFGPASPPGSHGRGG